MSRIEKTVFISYRRTNVPWALAIYQNLTSQGYDVFFDYLSIKSGDFEQIILGNIKARAHFIAILTPSALDRCNEPRDWLRLEIETAMDEKRNIVPVMLESFDFGTPSIRKALTGKLDRLKKYNGLRVHSDYFFEGMRRLHEQFLTVALDTVIHPVSENTKSITEMHQTSAAKEPLVAKEQLTSQEWYEKANLHNDLGNFIEAIRCYNEAISLNSDFPEAINNKGIVKKRTGNLEGAIEDFTLAMEYDFPELYKPYLNRALALSDMGDIEGAVADYTETIRINPDNYQAFYNRGNFFGKRGDLDRAISDLTKAIRLNPDLPEIYNNRGIVYMYKGDLEKAIIDFTKSCEYDFPELYNPYVNRADAYATLGNTDDAIADYSQAIRIEPNIAITYLNRAELFEQKNDYIKAIEDYQKYLDLGGGEQDGDQKEVEDKIKILRSKLRKKKLAKKKKSK